jgi:hypothetical protein
MSYGYNWVFLITDNMDSIVDGCGAVGVFNSYKCTLINHTTFILLCSTTVWVGDVNKLKVYLLHFMPSLTPDLGSEDVSHCSLEYIASYGSRFIMG